MRHLTQKQISDRVNFKGCSRREALSDLRKEQLVQHMKQVEGMWRARGTTERDTLFLDTADLLRLLRAYTIAP